jgi:hypothetical protein
MPTGATMLPIHRRGSGVASYCPPSPAGAGSDTKKDPARAGGRRPAGDGGPPAAACRGGAAGGRAGAARPTGGGPGSSVPGGPRWPLGCALRCGRLRAQAEVPSALRPDIHEEASVKTKEQDEHGTSQTSIRHHPHRRSAMKEYAVAPIHASGVALRHVGPRDAT